MRSPRATMSVRLPLPSHAAEEFLLNKLSSAPSGLLLRRLSIITFQTLTKRLSNASLGIRCFQSRGLNPSYPKCSFGTLSYFYLHALVIYHVLVIDVIIRISFPGHSWKRVCFTLNVNPFNVFISLLRIYKNLSYCR